MIWVRSSINALKTPGWNPLNSAVMRPSMTKRTNSIRFFPNSPAWIVRKRENSTIVKDIKKGVDFNRSTPFHMALWISVLINTFQKTIPSWPHIHTLLFFLSLSFVQYPIGICPLLPAVYWPERSFPRWRPNFPLLLLHLPV